MTFSHQHGKTLHFTFFLSVNLLPLTHTHHPPPSSSLCSRVGECNKQRRQFKVWWPCSSSRTLGTGTPPLRVSGEVREDAANKILFPQREFGSRGWGWKSQPISMQFCRTLEQLNSMIFFFYVQSCWSAMIMSEMFELLLRVRLALKSWFFLSVFFVFGACVFCFYVSWLANPQPVYWVEECLTYIYTVRLLYLQMQETSKYKHLINVIEASSLTLQTSTASVTCLQMFASTHTPLLRSLRYSSNPEKS